MDIVETVLHSCNAEKYIQNFKECGVTDMQTLKLLEEEDLEIIFGDNNSALIEKLLRTIKNLQLPTEKEVIKHIDDNYVDLVLSQMSLQMHRHMASLSLAANRKDVEICDMELTPAAMCLIETINSFENTLNIFEKKVCDRKKKKKIAYVVVPALLITTLILFSCKKYFKL